jgi:hypothetical protein
MLSSQEEWRPGSFTKNFGWGEEKSGLRQLHKAIRIGFSDSEEDVPRELFRSRVRAAGIGDYIPINFFLLNRTSAGEDYIAFDELVFQAVTAAYSARFDKLALFAFNFSYVGRWSGARPYQARPALWASHYILDRVARDFDWNVARVTADDIESFVVGDPRYHAQGARKLATNLNYLYKIGRLSEFAEARVNRWWVDALFLALDRLIEDRRLRGIATTEHQYSSMLSNAGFHGLSGKRSLEKDLALKHLIRLYSECGSRDRFSAEHMQERTAVRLPDLQWYIANDQRPQGAVHLSNPRALKTIPRACAMLAKYAAGFEIIEADELSNFDPDEFIRKHTREALSRLRDRHIKPDMSAEELMRLTRDHDDIY